MIIEGVAIHIMRKTIIVVTAILIVTGLLLGYRNRVKKQEQSSHYIVVTNYVVVTNHIVVHHEYPPTKFVPGPVYPIYERSYLGSNNIIHGENRITNYNLYPWQLPIVELPAVRQFLSDQSK